jgi:hypothetical protein
MTHGVAVAWVEKFRFLKNSAAIHDQNGMFGTRWSDA